MINKYSPLNNKASILKKTVLTDNPGLLGIGLSLMITNDLSPALIRRYLSSAEISRSKNRPGSIAGRCAAKKAISQAIHEKIPCKEISILSSNSSRPVISSTRQSLKYSPNLALSITHEDEIAAAIAVTSSFNISVGIDVARIDRVQKAFNNKKVLDYVLTQNEQELYSKTPDSALFWSCKEAAAKALGIGIWHGGFLKDIEITDISELIEMRFKNKLKELFEACGFKSIKIYYTADNNFKLSVALISP